MSTVSYYENILYELREAGIEVEFTERLKKLSGGTVFNQPMFDLLYTTWKLNPHMFD